MARMDIDGTPIHYEVSGRDDGPWLVFSNSLGTNLSMWDAQAAYFADRYRILRYDSRGHGQSSVPEGAYTMAQLGGDALALMDELGIEQANVCGLSKGGMVGMWLGANAGERLHSLALCNTAAHMPPPELWDERIAAVSYNGMVGLAQSVLERWFTPSFREARPEAVERIRAMLMATPAHGYSACCGAIRDMDQRSLLPRIAVPTLVVAGAHDPATPPAKAEEIAAAVPDARLVVLDAAHLSNIEAEAAFNEALDAHLAA